MTTTEIHSPPLPPRERHDELSDVRLVGRRRRRAGGPPHRPGRLVRAARAARARRPRRAAAVRAPGAARRGPPADHRDRRAVRGLRPARSRAPDAADFDSTTDAATHLVAAIDRGELDDVDAAARWLGRAAHRHRAAEPAGRRRRAPARGRRPRADLPVPPAPDRATRRDQRRAAARARPGARPRARVAAALDRRATASGRCRSGADERGAVRRHRRDAARHARAGPDAVHLPADVPRRLTAGATGSRPTSCATSSAAVRSRSRARRCCAPRRGRCSSSRTTTRRTAGATASRCRRPCSASARQWSPTPRWRSPRRTSSGSGARSVGTTSSRDFAPPDPDVPLAEALATSPDLAAAAAWHLPEERVPRARRRARDACVRAARRAPRQVHARLPRRRGRRPRAPRLFLTAAASLVGWWSRF